MGGLTSVCVKKEAHYYRANSLLSSEFHYNATIISTLSAQRYAQTYTHTVFRINIVTEVLT